MPLGEQAADQRRRAVIDLERSLEHDAAPQVGPAPGVHVRVADLELRVGAALALALDAQLERDPAQPDVVAVRERERRIEGEEGVRDLL